MNWLTDYVKPKLSSLVTRKEPPSDLWTKCGCGERTLYVSDLKENLNVCSYCDYHMNMDVNSRLKNLFGDNSFELIEVPFEKKISQWFVLVQEMFRKNNKCSLSRDCAKIKSTVRGHVFF